LLQVFLKAIGFVLLLVILFGLFTLDYQLGAVVLVLSFVLGLVVVLGPHGLSKMRHWGALEWLTLFVGMFLLLLTIVVAFVFPRSVTNLLSGLTTRVGGGGGGGEVPTLMSYRAELYPVTKSATGHFSLIEDITVKVITVTGRAETKRYRLPARILSATGDGLLLNEIAFEPLGAAPPTPGSPPQANVLLPDGNVFFGPLCLLACPSSEVVIHSLPLDSFVQSKEGSVSATPFGSTETVQWQLSNPEDGVAFSYIESPWEFLHKPLSPLLGVASAGEFLKVLFVLLYAALFTAGFAWGRKHVVTLFWSIVRVAHPAVPSTSRMASGTAVATTGAAGPRALLSKVTIDLTQASVAVETVDGDHFTTPLTADDAPGPKTGDT